MSLKVETLAGMKVIRLLGKGAMSEVYEVENVKFASRHAIKLYSYPQDREDICRRFQLEGQLLAKLNHPRIVKVIDSGVDAESGKPYFVMDLILSPDGTVKSLADVQSGEVDEKVIGRWYDDIREGLAYIHGKGVVHRDLKLQNILIGPDGHAVITDFGISRIFNPDDGSDTIVDPVETIVRMQGGKKPIMGSVGYMAPELEMGATATDKSDWYALGVVIFKLLTGTWCDARTNIASLLSSYDPVWMEIMPFLLHSNPEGRKCLSYSEEKERLDELKLSKYESLIEGEERRTKMLYGITGAVSVIALVLAVIAGFQHNRLSLPSFDSVFAIPQSATEEETDVFPSRNQFELALFDAQALTSSIFANLKTGEISRAKAKNDLCMLLKRTKQEDFEIFSQLPEGFVSSGEMRALSILFEEAVKKMQ
jgi:serine/threonine protein kinase